MRYDGCLTGRHVPVSIAWAILSVLPGTTLHTSPYLAIKLRTPSRCESVSLEVPRLQVG